MNTERLAEWRTFALESIPQIARLSDGSESERVIISTCASAILELIDALTAERARADEMGTKWCNALRQRDELASLAGDLLRILDGNWFTAHEGYIDSSDVVKPRLRARLKQIMENGK